MNAISCVNRLGNKEDEECVDRDLFCSNVRYNDAMFMLWFGLKYPYCTYDDFRCKVPLETKRRHWNLYQRERVLMF